MNDFFIRLAFDSSVQLAILVTVVAGIVFFGRRMSARFRYMLWTLVLIKALLPPFFAVPWSVANQAVEPIWQLFSQKQTIATQQTTITQNADLARAPDERLSDENHGVIVSVLDGVNEPDFSGAATSADTSRISNAVSRFPWLFAVWLGGVLIFWSVVLSCYGWATGLLAKGNWLHDGPIHELLARLAGWLGIRKTPQVVLSDSVRSPFLWGFSTPCIAIPADFPGEVGPDEMESVLLHELAHWKRGDLFVARLELLVRSLFWFHPFVWFALYQLRKARESACDETVLASGYIAAKRYGDSLLNVMLAIREPSVVPVGFLGFLGILERKTQLQQRLEEIMSQQHRVKRIGLFGWGFLLFLILCVLPMAIAQNNPPKAEDKPAKPKAAETTADPNAPPRLDFVERDGKFYIQGDKGEILAEPLSAAPAGTKAEPKELGLGYLKRSKLAASLGPLSREDFAKLCPNLSQQYADTGWTVKDVFRGGAFDKAGVCPDDILIGVENWKINSQKALEYFTGYRYDRDQNLKAWIIRKDHCYYVDVPVAAWQGPADGGFVTPDSMQCTHLVTFGPKGDFAPINPRQFLRPLRPELEKQGVISGYFRTKPVDGKLIAMMLTDDPEGLKKAIGSVPQLKYIKTERLTKEMFEEYEKTKQESLPPADGGFVSPIGFTHMVVIGSKGGFEPKTKTSFTRAVSEAFKDAGIGFGVVRSRVEDGKLILIELTDEPDEMKRVIDASPNLQYLRAERLTDQAMYDEYFKNYDNSHFLPPEDGGFMYHGHKYLITLKPKGDFAPKSQKEYSDIINTLAPWAFSGYSKSKVEDGKLIMMQMTDDAQIMKEVFESSDKIEVTKVERLTKEIFEEYEKLPRVSLPTENMLKVMETDWYKKLNKAQQNYVAWDENTFAHVYDPKNYDVGNKRGEFEAKWVKLLEGREPGSPENKKLHPYDEAIFGLATIKSEKAAKLLAKIAAERVVKDNAHRHFSAKALGMLGDPSVVPDLIPLLYHFNMNVRWDAQIALVRLTGQNFGRDAEAWGKWYNENRETLGKNLPAFDPTPVDWTFGSNNEQLKSYSNPEKQKEVDRQWGE